MRAKERERGNYDNRLGKDGEWDNEDNKDDKNNNRADGSNDNADCRQLKNTRQSNTQRDGQRWQQKRIEVIRILNNNSHNHSKIIIVIIIITSVFWGCACLFSLSSWTSYPSTLFDRCIIIAVAVAVAVAVCVAVAVALAVALAVEVALICQQYVADMS